MTSPIRITIEGGDEQMRMLVAAAIDNVLRHNTENKISNSLVNSEQILDFNRLSTMFRLAYQANPDLKTTPIIIQKGEDHE